MMTIQENRLIRCAQALGVSAVLALATGCSEPHDFTGTYIVTSGDDCSEDNSGGRTPVLMTISPGAGGADKMVYTAHLSQFASAMGLPLESRPTKVSDDGSLKFEFFEEGKRGLFTGKDSKYVEMKLVVRDDDHLLLKSWPMALTMPGSPEPGFEIDFVKDKFLQMPGVPGKLPNEIATIAGEDGLCLLKQR